MIVGPDEEHRCATDSYFDERREVYNDDIEEEEDDLVEDEPLEDWTTCDECGEEYDLNDDDDSTEHSEPYCTVHKCHYNEDVEAEFAHVHCD